MPLNVLLKPREVAYHLKDSDAKALIAFEGTAELPLAAIAKAACDEARCPNLFLMMTAPDAPSPIPGVPTLSEAMRAGTRRAVRHAAAADGRYRGDPLHLRDHRSPERRGAHPRQHAAERRGVPRHVPAGDAGGHGAGRRR